MKDDLTVTFRAELTNGVPPLPYFDGHPLNTRRIEWQDLGDGTALIQMTLCDLPAELRDALEL